MTTVHPIALQRWPMASLVIRFVSSLIPSNQRTNFCNFVTKENKIAKTIRFPGNFAYKALRALRATKRKKKETTKYQIRITGSLS